MRRPSQADLSGFVAVARHRSFRRAAELTGVSRSTLSHSVIDMERDIDIRLLDRTSRGISLTEAGAELFDRATALLRDYDEALDAMAGASGIVGGTLRINFTDTERIASFKALSRPFSNSIGASWPMPVRPLRSKQMPSRLEWTRLVSPNDQP